MDNFHQSQNLEYRLLKRGYLLYQHEVIKLGKTFELHIRDYLSEIQNIHYKTEKELSVKSRIHARVSDIFLLRADLVERYFGHSDFIFTDYKNLIRDYNTTVIAKEETLAEDTSEQGLPIVDDLEEKLLKVRAEILKYESGEKQPKHIGQRMFGYLLKANYFIAYNDEQRLTEWQNFTGLDSKPEMSYLRDPDYNKNETDKINKQLKSIEEFFYLVELDIFIKYQKEKLK